MCPAVAAAPPQPDVAEYWYQVFWRERALASITVGRWKGERLFGREAVNADIKETAHRHTEQGEDDEENDIH